MRLFLSFVTLAFLCITLYWTPGCATPPDRPSAASAPKEFLTPIFDGKTLNGWEHKGGGSFTVEDGVIVGKNSGRPHGWLCTQKTYRDFILELEVNLKSGNSGVQIRSHFEDNEKMVGKQIEADPTPRAWSGGLFDQGRRGWLQDVKTNEVARKAFKVGEWNKYRIVCKGDHIQSWVNGVPVTDFNDPTDFDGFIALQAHSGSGTEVRFRNIRLQDLGGREAKPKM